jgi:PAS domain S-box-containing protein
MERAQTEASIEDLERELELVADLGAAWLDLPTEKDIYASLAEGVRKVVGDQAIIAVSNYDANSRSFKGQAILGLGSFVEKVTALVGVRPIDITADYPESVKRVMTSGRVTRLEGGVVELAAEAIPPVLSRQVVALLGLHDVFVVGFARTGFAGGISIITRRPGMLPRRAPIEAMARLAAVALERKRAEAALRESEARYRSLFDNMLNGCAYCQIVYDGDMAVDWVYLTVNAAFETLTGVGAVTGRKVSEVIPGIRESDPELFEHYGRVARTGVPEHFEMFHHALKRWRSVSVYSPQRDHVVVVFEDISDRKRTVEALRTSEQLFRSFFDLPLIGICMISPRSAWMEANDRACAMVGYGREELHCIRWTDLSHPDGIEREQEQIDRLLRGEAEMYVLEKRLVRKSGETFDAEVAVGCVRGDGRRILYFVALIQDITDRRRAEEERRRLQEQLLYARKLESLGVLAGGVAHDFNNLLGAIIGNVELALGEIPESSPARACALDVQDAARRASKLTKQMLAYSGKGRFENRELDLNGAVADEALVLRPSMPSNAVLDLRLAPRLPSIQGDVSQLRQVVRNLVTNAWEAIDPGRKGVVTLRSGADTFAQPYLMRSRAPWQADAGPYVYFEVADDGSGMDAETLERLFDPFFSTRFTGRGLGMAAVLGIVRGHHGAIVVDSAVGKGTTVRVLFPVLDQ